MKIRYYKAMDLVPDDIILKTALWGHYDDWNPGTVKFMQSVFVISTSVSRVIGLGNPSLPLIGVYGPAKHCHYRTDSKYYDSLWRFLLGQWTTLNLKRKAIPHPTADSPP